MGVAVQGRGSSLGMSGGSRLFEDYVVESIATLHDRDPISRRLRGPELSIHVG